MRLFLIENYNSLFWLLCDDEQRASFIDFFNHALKQKTLETAQSIAAEIDATAAFKLSYALAIKYATGSNIAKNLIKYKTIYLSGDCYQINLAQRFSAQYSGSEYQAYCALRRRKQSAFFCFFTL